MRKVIVTAFVALLAILAFATCDNNLAGQNDDGMVTLSISTGETAAGNSRSLTDALAHDEANYLEVIFKYASGAKYFRAGSPWALRNSLKITIPVGTYATGTANDAILLIGRRSDGTLLAIGKLNGSNVVTADGDTVKFTVSSLEASLSVAAPATYDDTTLGPYSPSFAINETSLIDTTWLAGFSKKGTYEGVDDSKCFQVPVSKNGITATLTITNLYNSGSSIILVDGTKLTPAVPVTDQVKFNLLSTTDTVSAVALTNTVGENLGDTTTPKPITFTFTTGTYEAQYYITFKIPVAGFAVYVPAVTTGTPTPEENPGLKNALTWFIRGGTIADLPDTTGDGEEGVALVVTSAPNEKVKVGIETGTGTDPWK